MQHERETLERITALRTKAVTQRTSEQLRIYDELTPAIHGIVAQVENYPTLYASQQFQMLQRNLTEVEEQLSAARRAYNAAVMDYNTSTQIFPSNLFAALFGFKAMDPFSIVIPTIEKIEFNSPKGAAQSSPGQRPGLTNNKKASPEGAT